MGQGQGTGREKLPKKWFTAKCEALKFAKGSTVAESFLCQFSNNPGRILFADQISGCRTNRDIVTGIFLLRPLFEKCAGKNLGIMLPPSVSAFVTYLAALFSGKTPVMFNWTGGIGNMAHGIEMTCTRTIITANKLYQRIEEQQDVKLSQLPVKLLFLGEAASSITLPKKVLAVVKSFASW